MKYRWFDFGEKKIPYYKKEIGEISDLLHCALSIKKGQCRIILLEQHIVLNT